MKKLNQSATMAKYVLIIVALALIAMCEAKPKTAEPTAVEEIAATAQEAINQAKEKLGLNDLPDSKQIVDTLNNGTKNLAENLQQLADKLGSEIKAHQGEADSAIKTIKDQLSATITKLQQTAGPDATAKAKEIGTNLDSALGSALEQAKKLMKAVEPDATKAKAEIQNAAETLMSQIASIATNVKNDVKTSLEQHEKTHKH